jgi:uncharacterized protein YcnI
MKIISTRVRALILACLTGALVLGVAAPAFGHATVQLYGSTPKANGYGAFWIRIGHGCEDAKGNPVSVNKVSVFLQGAFQSGRPQQIAGWKSSVVQLKNNAGYRLDWVATGDALRDDEFQDFGISTKYPMTVGTYRVPAIQYCGAYKTAWVEKGHDADHPAATITIGAAAASSH